MVDPDENECGESGSCERSKLAGCVANHLYCKLIEMKILAMERAKPKKKKSHTRLWWSFGHA